MKAEVGLKTQNSIQHQLLFYGSPTFKVEVSTAAPWRHVSEINTLSALQAVIAVAGEINTAHNEPSF